MNIVNRRKSRSFRWISDLASDRTTRHIFALIGAITTLFVVLSLLPGV